MSCNECDFEFKYCPCCGEPLTFQAKCSKCETLSSKLVKCVECKDNYCPGCLLTDKNDEPICFSCCSYEYQ